MDREKEKDFLKNAPIIKREKMGNVEVLTFKGGKKAIFKAAKREKNKKKEKNNGTNLQKQRLRRLLD